MLLNEQYTFEVNPSSFTKEDKLQSENILYWFQEAASQHSEKFHIGFHDLIKDNIIWMVARNKYEILSDFPKNKKVIIETWPHPYSSFEIERDYLLKDEEGKVYIKGTSLWCLYSKEKQRLMPTKCAEIEGAEYCLEKNFDEPFLRIAITESDAFKTCFQHTINVEDVDRNGHMNNCRYSHLVDLALLEGEKEIQRFEINYVMQCYEHEELVIKKYRKEKEIFVLGEKKEGIVFITRILLR